MDEPKKAEDVLNDDANTPTPEDIKLASIEAIDKSNETTEQTLDEPTAVTDASAQTKEAPIDEKASPYVASTHTAVSAREPINTKAKRFMIAYLTTVFSALSLLSSVSFLGFVLFNHFFGPKADEELSLFYFDLAPVYISVIASIITFGALYIVASRYVAKSASDDTIALKDWRVYKVVYAVFAAFLFAVGASVLGSLLYIPLAQALIAGDLESKQITVLILGNLHVLLWIGLLVWQERLVKHGKASWLQGTIVVLAALVVVVLTAIYPIGSKTDDRFDHRISNDLSAIESKIDKFKSENKDELPATLDIIGFKDEPVKGRLTQYSYKVNPVEKPKSTTLSSQELLKRMAIDEALGESLESDEEGDEDYDTSLFGGSGVSIGAVSQNKTYEICATFKTDTSSKKGSGTILDNLSAATSGTTAQKGNSDAFTKHKTGKVCFNRS